MTRVNLEDLAAIEAFVAKHGGLKGLPLYPRKPTAR